MADLFTSLVYVINIIICNHCNCSKISQLLFTIFGIYWPVSSFLWTDCIAIYIFGASYQKKWINPTKRLFASFHIISWFVPLLICLVIVGLYIDDNGQMELSSQYTGGWCVF